MNRTDWIGSTVLILALLFVVFLHGSRVVLADTSVVPTGIESTSDTTRIHGYYAWWMRDSWKSMDLSIYDRLIFFTLRLNDQGQLSQRNGWPEAWGGLIGAVHDVGAKIVPTVAMMDPAKIKRLFADPLRIETLVDSIEEMLRESGADGVHIDVELFEPGSPGLRDGFTAFIENLDKRLELEFPGADLTVFVPAFDVSGIFDIRRLSEAADLLIVQGYDLHWQTGPEAGPVAPLSGWNGANWTTILDRFLGEGILPEKIVMTIPYFGYEWPTETEAIGSPTRGEGREITLSPVDSSYLPLIRVSALERVKRFGLRMDSVSGSPYYAYRDDSGWHQGWYEDESTLAAKYRFIQNRNIGGIAVFLLGYDGGRYEPLLRRFFRR